MSEKPTMEQELLELVQFDRYQHDKKCGVTITRDLGNCDCNKDELMGKLKALIAEERLEAKNELWGFTYGFLHSNDKSLCNEWEEALANKSNGGTT